MNEIEKYVEDVMEFYEMERRAREDVKIDAFMDRRIEKDMKMLPYLVGTLIILIIIICQLT